VEVDACLCAYKLPKYVQSFQLFHPFFFPFFRSLRSDVLPPFLPPSLPSSPSTTQTYHGGQDWRNIGNFIEDFSVTTNGLGTPVKALEAARKAVRKGGKEGDACPHTDPCLLSLSLLFSHFDQNE